MKLVEITGIGSYALPEHQRDFFKKPLDRLYRSEKEISQILSNIAKDSAIPKVISVGDVTTKLLLSNNLIPDLAIIDEYVQRKKVPMLDINSFMFREAKNPAATITREAWMEIRKAIHIFDVKFLIKIPGEEDLLVIPAVFEAPLNSKVLYGQPNEGLVVVTVNKEIKQKVQALMQKMVKTDEN